MILREEAIESYKAFKKSHTNENNGLTVIDTSPEENIQGSEEKLQDLEENIQDSLITQEKTNKFLSIIKAINIMIGQIKHCRLTRINRKLKTKLEFKYVCK